MQKTNPLINSSTVPVSGTSPYDTATPSNAILEQAFTGDSFPALAPLQTMPSSLVDQAKAKQEREAKTSTYDYAAAAFSQDSAMKGLMAHLAQKHTFDTPDETYNPLDRGNLDELSAGLPDEYRKEFYNATSKGHAYFIRERLSEKMSDLEKLGDLGAGGTVGRFALGLVAPENLAMMAASGGTSALLRGAATLRRASTVAPKIVTSLDAVKAAEGATQGIIKSYDSKLSLGALAGGVAVAGGSGYAFERMRQSVNFEDSQSDAIVAGLFATALGGAAAYVGARGITKARNTAHQELHVLSEIRKEIETGQPIKPETHAIAEELVARQKTLLEDTGEGPSPDTPKTSSDPFAPSNAKTLKELLRREVETNANPEVNTLGPFEPLANKTAGDVPMTAMEAAFRKALGTNKDVAEVVRTVRENAAAKTPEQIAAEIDAAYSQREVAIQKAEKVKAGEERAILAAASRENLDLVSVPKEDAKAAISERAATKDVNPDAPEVFWPDKDGNVFSGTAVDTSKPGSVTIEPHDGSRPVEIERAELAHDSPLYEPPESSGNFIESGSVGAAQIAPVRPYESPLTFGAKLRRDIFAQLDKSENQTIRRLAELLVKDASQRNDVFAQKMTASEDKKLMTRVLTGGAHKEMSLAFNDAKELMGWNSIRAGFYALDFHNTVGMLKRHIDNPIETARILDTGYNRQIEAPLMRAVKGVSEFYDKALTGMKQAGVDGAEHIQQNASYINRVWDVAHMSERTRQLDELFGKGKGDQFLTDLVEAAYKPDPAYKGPRTKRETAGYFLGAIKALEYKGAAREFEVGVRTEKSLRDQLAKLDIGDAQTQAVIDTMFERKASLKEHAGEPEFAQSRAKLDEAASIDLPDGSVLRMSDLLENDARVLVDKYANTTLGATALAKQGFKSKADWDAMVAEAIREHDSAGFSRNGTQFAEELKMLQDTYDHTSGRPMSIQTFNKGDQVLSTIRTLSRSITLGQLGFTAALETLRVGSKQTWGALYQQMPSLRRIVQEARAGKKPTESFRIDVEQFLGHGQDNFLAYARQNDNSEYNYNRYLTAADNFANKAAHVIDHVSGNNYVTAASRNLAARTTIQNMVNMALGKEAVNEGWINRFVGKGIDRHEFPAVLKDLKDYATVKDGVVTSIDHERWSAESNDTFQSFRTAIDRYTRDIIQDQDLGETWHFQHSTLGKVITELKAFSIAAHAKQTVNGLYYRDAKELMVWTTSFASQALGYVVRTSMNFSHDPAELEKRLTADKIVRASIANMGELGILPMVFDTFVAKPLFPAATLSGQGLTANTDNRSLFSTPSTALIGKAVSTLQAVPQSLVGGQNFTGQDFKNAAGLVPGQNTWFLRNFVDGIAKTFPQKELPLPK